MSVTVESLCFAKPNPSLGPSPSSSLSRPSMALRASQPSLRFRSFLRPPNCRVSAATAAVSPRGLGLRFLTLSRSQSRRPSLVSFVASREDPSHSDVEVESKNDIDSKAQESEEAWKQTVESFKEQAMKMQSVSQEAYELYSKKAAVILKETAVQLKIQADKAQHDLRVLAKEITEDGKEYLSAAAENSPKPVKDVVETFATSVDDLTEISKVYDFYLGIPYGLLLTLGGFISFMLTGSISAIRFGIILGGALLALSISSLRSWKRGESFTPALKGQTVIAGILFLRELSILSQRQSIFSYLTTLISGAMLAFYLYRIKLSSTQSKDSNQEHRTQE